MQTELAPMRAGPMLPEVNGLPGAEQQAAPLKAQAQARAGEGRADVGRHVIRSFIVMHVGAQGALAAQRPHALGWHQGLQEGREVDQHPGIGIFVDREGATGVKAGEHRQACAEPGCTNFLIETRGEVGEALAPSRDLQMAEPLLQHGSRPGPSQLRGRQARPLPMVPPAAPWHIPFPSGQLLLQRHGGGGGGGGGGGDRHLLARANGPRLPARCSTGSLPMPCASGQPPATEQAGLPDDGPGGIPG